jgi:hypothetical protein
MRCRPSCPEPDEVLIQLIAARRCVFRVMQRRPQKVWAGSLQTAPLPITVDEPGGAKNSAIEARANSFHRTLRRFLDCFAHGNT